MIIKVLLAFALVAAASGGYLQTHHVYHTQPVLAKSPEPYDPHPHYHFAYAVHDEHTGDVKSQFESRDGDAVKGEYSLIDSDGYKRIVKYTADHDHGFNAVVEREPIAHSIKLAPVVKAAPIASYIPKEYSNDH